MHDHRVDIQTNITNGNKMFRGKCIYFDYILIGRRLWGRYATECCDIAGHSVIIYMESHRKRRHWIQRVENRALGLWISQPSTTTHPVTIAWHENVTRGGGSDTICTSSNQWTTYRHGCNNLRLYDGSACQKNAKQNIARPFTYISTLHESICVDGRYNSSCMRKSWGSSTCSYDGSLRSYEQRVLGWVRGLRLGEPKSMMTSLHSKKPFAFHKTMSICSRNTYTIF